MMPPWFPGYGLLKHLFQIFLAATVSKCRLDINLIVCKKAWAKPAVCGKPEAIARRAEVVTNGTDETDLPSG
jgi:hypothetical protein